MSASIVGRLTALGEFSSRVVRHAAGAARVYFAKHGNHASLRVSEFDLAVIVGAALTAAESPAVRFVLAVGNPNGFAFYGPFDSREDADTYARSRLYANTPSREYSINVCHLHKPFAR
jgi:hypothetical protein